VGCSTSVASGKRGPVYFDTAVFVFVTGVVSDVVVVVVVVVVMVVVVAWSVGLPVFFLKGGDVALEVVFLVGAVFAATAKVNPV
jgi:hypothetical protein